MRIALLALVVLYICAYSFRNWYKSLCIFLPVIAFLERPDMPREIMGVPGLNAYNIMLFFILIGFVLRDKSKCETWTVPGNITKLLIVYVVVLSISFIRMMFDMNGFLYYSVYMGEEIPTYKSLVIEQLVNAWKFVIPGILLAYGANSEENINDAIKSIMLVSIFLALQIIIKILPDVVAGGDLQDISMRKLNRDIGYHRGELAPFMAASAWFFMVLYAEKFIKYRFLLLLGFMMCSLALVMTGGRGGLVAWAVCCIYFGLIKWRKLLIVIPISIVVFLLIMPQVENRFTEGFTEDSYEKSAEDLAVNTIDSEGRDTYAITSGRVILWPAVIESIKQSIWFGYGEKAMVRLSIFPKLIDQGLLHKDAGFGHPHNAYLQLLLDTGVVGTILILMFFLKLLILSTRQIINSTNREDQMLAGIYISFCLVQFAHGITADSFYPKQGSVLMWCSIGLFMANLGKQNKEKKTLVQGPINRSKAYR